MPTYGYKPGSVAAGYADTDTINSRNELVTVGPKMAEHGWAYQVRIRGGRATSDVPTVVGELRDVDTGNNPTDLIERTDAFTTGTAMLSASDGIEYVRPLRAAAQMRSGKRYGTGLVACDGTFGYGILPAASVPAGNNTTIYRRSLAEPTPQDPMGFTQSTPNSGWIAVAVDYETNVAPHVPGTLSPVDGAVGLPITPTFSGDFRDDNETLPNGLAADRLGKVHIQLFNDDSGALLWDFVYPASDAEKAARQWTRVYDGPDLDLATTYRWQARVADQLGAFSDFTDPRTFTCGGPRVVISSSNPTGKIETVRPDFGFTYHNDSGANSAKAQVIVKDADSGQTLRVSGFIPLVLPPDTSYVIPFDDLTNFPALGWGGHYRYSVIVEDHDGLRSVPGTGRAFNVDAAPSIPVILIPDASEVVTSRPEIIATATDEDDTVASGLAVTLEILDNTGDVLQARAMTLDASLTNWPYPIWRYQTTAGDLATAGTYRVRAYAFDGTVYSGGHTGSPTRSDEVTFVYAVGPVVTNLSPANGATVTTNTPDYDWSAADQVKCQIQVYQTFEDGSELLVYDTGPMVRASTHFVQEAGYLESGSHYYRKISVWNSLNQLGVSTAAYFAVDFAIPPSLGNVTASPYLADGDPPDKPSAILLSWDPSTFADHQFKYCRITRRVADDTPIDVDDPVGLDTVVVADVRGTDNTSYVDLLPASGVTYVYGVKQLVTIDGVDVMGYVTHVEIGVQFDTTIVCDARRANSRRAVLQWRRDREVEPQRDQSFETPWGQMQPTEVRSRQWSRAVNCEFAIAGDTPADVEAVIRRLERMDASGGPLCWRDGRGHRWFGTITAFRAIDPPGHATRRVVLGFRQTNAREVFV
jgi:hypothetical protein